MTFSAESLASVQLYDDEVIGAGRLMRDDGGREGGSETKACMGRGRKAGKQGKTQEGWRMTGARGSYARSRGKRQKTKGGKGDGARRAGGWVAVGGCRGWNEILICGGARNPCSRPALVHHFPPITRRCERRRNSGRFCEIFLRESFVVSRYSRPRLASFRRYRYCYR